jgi:DNA helicase-2/ATP-dependent DNA helicase PcrA
LPRGDFHLEEERRLFYVALTRARQSLVLSTISNQRRRPSIFLDELAETPPPDLVRKKPILPADTKTPESSARLVSRIEQWAAAPVPLSAEDFALSISQLQTYLECPLKYQFRHVWRVPVPPTPPLLFGIVLHNALKDVVSAVAQASAILTRQATGQILEHHWPASGFPDPVQERKYREMGLEQLEGVCQAWSGQEFELLYQEKPFELRLGGCKVVGRMDQVHRRAGGGVELIEYKTGRPYTKREVDTSRQLTLYARACREVLGLEPAALILYNLSSQEAIRTERETEDFQALEKTIRETNRQILAGRFPAQPGYHCRFCAFRPLCPAHEDAGGEAEPVT